MKKVKKRYFSAFMAMILFVGTVSISQQVFAASSDISGHWAESTITKWENGGLIRGYPDGTFRPNHAISRAEFVTLANKAFGYTTPTVIAFKDVNPSYWAYGEIQKGVAAGYIKGDAAGTFRPGAAVTRQEAAVMIAQIKSLKQDAYAALKYKDYSAIANWAKPYVGAVSNVGIMQGFPNGAFKPQTSITRAEAVTALEKAIFTNASSQPSTPNEPSKPTTPTIPPSTVEDYTLTDSVLRNKTIDGDLVISSSLSNRSVLLDNVTVKGTVKVQGGSTIKAEDCDLNVVELDKSSVVFQSNSDTNVNRLEFLKKGEIEGQGYDNVSVQDSDLTEVIIDGKVDYLEFATDANLKLYKNADVATLNVQEDAKNGEVTFTSGSSVDKMDIHGKIRIYGRGDIGTMTVYVSGIRSSIKPDDLILREDGEKPSYNSGSGGSSSSSGSEYDDLTLDRADRTYDEDGERYHNVSIEEDGITLRDAIIYNKLTITRDVEDGEVILDDLVIRGDVYIYGGGENSVIFRNCDIWGDILSDKDTDDDYGNEPVALEFEDDTQIDGEISVRGETILRAENDIDLNDVSVERNLDDEFVIDADIDRLNIHGDCDVRILSDSRITNVYVPSNTDVIFHMEGTSYIGTLDSDSDVVLRGNGTVKTIKTNKTITKDSGITSEEQSSTFVPVTDIWGIPTTGVTGQTLTLSPVVLPSTASYKTVKWSIDPSNNTCGATISNDKVLQTTKDGSVTLIATIENGAAQGSSFTKKFTITFATSTPPVIAPTLERISVSANKILVGDKIELTADTKGDMTGYTIHWNISGGTGAGTLSSVTGNPIELTATGAGTVTISAVLKNSAGITFGSEVTTTIEVTEKETPPATKIELKEIAADSTNVNTGGTATVTATVTNPVNGYKIKWSVNENGSVDSKESTVTTGTKSYNVTFKAGDKEGEATVTAQLMDSTDKTVGSAKTVNITVKKATDFTAVTGIEDVPTIGVVGEALTLKGTVKPNNATNKTIEWSIQDAGTTQATLTGNQLSAKNAGSVKVLATIEDGVAKGTNYTKGFTITFEDAVVTGITLNPNSQSYAKGDIITATAVGNGSLKGKEIEWSSSDLKYAEVTVNSSDSTKATIEILNADVSSAKTVNISAQVEGSQEKASATITIAATQTPTTPTLTGIKAGDNETNGMVSVEQGASVTLTALGENLDGKTLNWTIKENNSDKITLSSQNANTATLTIAGDASVNTEFTVKVAVDETNVFTTRQFKVVEKTPPQIELTRIAANPTDVNIGGTATVTATVTNPANGYKIKWSISEVTATDSQLSDTESSIQEGITSYNVTFTAKNTEGEATVTAQLVDSTDKTVGDAKTVNITVKKATGFTPVTGIEDVPTIGVVGEDLTLNGTVKPDNVTNQNIVWSIQDPNTIGAAINNNNQLSAKSAGSVTVLATIENGKSENEDYTKEFSITFENKTTGNAANSPSNMQAMPFEKEKSFVKNITLPTQEAQAGTSFDLSQAVVEANGKNNFTVEWIVGAGMVEMLDEHTISMNTAGQVTMTAVVTGGKQDGSVYTQDFVITFTQPTVLEEAEKTESIPMIPLEKAQKEEEKIIMTEVEESEEEKEEIPMTQAQKPEKQEVPMTQVHETEFTPVQKPVMTEQTVTPITYPKDNRVIIHAMGSTIPNSDIILVAKDTDGLVYENAFWSIVNDGGTNATIFQNKLRTKNKGTVVVKVTIGNGIPRVSTKAITIR